MPRQLRCSFVDRARMRTRPPATVYVLISRRSFDALHNRIGAAIRTDVCRNPSLFYLVASHAHIHTFFLSVTLTIVVAGFRRLDQKNYILIRSCRRFFFFSTVQAASPLKHAARATDSRRRRCCYHYYRTV